MRYLHLDVFTDTPFEGNQLAVYPDPPRDLSAATMQKIANEMAFSETTFVFPRERNGDVRMRIFTPGTELPMAGHPTVGTTFALAAEGVIAKGRREFVFECGIGPIPVELEWSDSALSFVWMTQPLPKFGPQVEKRGEFAAAVGLEPSELVDLPVEFGSSGVPFLYVPVTTRAAVDRVAIDQAGVRRALGTAAGTNLSIFFFTSDRTGAAGDETVYSRMLAPDFGIAEDPATGSASGPLGCYLLRHGVVTADQAGSMLSLQGVAMKRPSRIFIAIDSAGGTITRVRVGGKAVGVGGGEVRF